MANPVAVDIFNDALALPLEERAAFLDRACGDDTDLRLDVESLLEIHRRLPPPQEAPDVGEEHPAQIGRYRVVRELGRGGMGRVFLAEDPVLGRLVALKMLPRRLANRSEYFSRLDREAQILASLHHPNIATLFSLERAEESPILTMEWVAGETLAARLGRLPAGEGLGLLETARIGTQACHALQYAHKRGVVHRDLKPANVALTEDGDAKLLDFGLAKAASVEAVDAVSEPGVGLSSTETAASLTLPGLVRGSPGYMSPEHIRSGATGPASDVWALACIVFECLAGAPAFPGANAAERIASTLEQEPPWSRLPGETPEGLRLALEQCLTKDPASRARSADRLQEQLDLIATGGRFDSAQRVPAVAWRDRRVLWLLAVVLIGGGLAAWRALDGLDRPATIDPPPDLLRVTFGGEVLDFDVAPDSRNVALVTVGGSLILHDLVSHGERTLYTAPDLRTPRWSPEGDAILVTAPGSDGRFRALVLDPQGDSVTEVGPPSFVAMDWTPDGKAIAGGLFQTVGCKRVLLVDRATGDTTSVPIHPEIGVLCGIEFSPSGSGLLVGGVSEAGFDATWYQESLTARPRPLPVQFGWGRVHWTGTGQNLLVLTATSNTTLQRFELDREGNVNGPPTTLEARGGATAFRTLDDGGVMYLCKNPTARLWVFNRDSQGGWKAHTLSTPSRSLMSPRLSPDLTQVAVSRTPSPDQPVIELVTLGDGSTRRFAVDGDADWLAWSPGGDRLAYRRASVGQSRSGWLLDVHTGETEQIFGPSLGYVYWSPARRLRFQPSEPVHEDYLVLEESTGAVTPLLGQPARGTVFHSAASPDGRWLAVAGNRNDIAAVAVWLVDLRDRSERLLYDATAVPVGWSRDGAWVYATIGRRDGDPSSLPRVIQISIRDGTVRTLVDLSGGELFRWSDVDVSPSGDRVVAVLLNPSADLWLSRRSGPPL